MATCNLQTQKPFSVFLAITITFFLLILNKVNSLAEVSVWFASFGPDQKDLIFQGDALVSPTGALQVTKVRNGKPIYFSTGRALFATPVQIWDSSTGKVANFVTSFTFVVNATDSAKTADGIAFFLAPPNTQIPPSSTGGKLGLFSNQYYDRSNQIVAVEFDTYSNSWDPAGRHIGIDVNSINSTKTATWILRNGEVANVDIYYEAASKTLTATLTYPELHSGERYNVSGYVDVKRVLPEWVRIGFSATTGETTDYVETHDVLSWSFASSFETSSGGGAKENIAHLASYA